MQQHLVVWGDIGTDRKALITIELIEESSKVIYHAFPKETVTKELQDQLFTIWKNGGAFAFPDDLLTWEVDSNADNLLPEDIKLHKPHILINAQRQWQKKVMLKNNFLLFKEKVEVLKLELDSLKAFDEKVWNNAKTLWNEILSTKKENLLVWQDADALKIKINEIFDGLKAFKRINNEKNYEESASLLQLYKKRINERIEKLVYPDEWSNIFNSFKEIQNEISKDNLTYKHKRILFNKLNAGFKDLRNYRKTNQIHHLEERISGLNRVLSGLDNAIEKDEESYQHQIEKMKHYTRGKMTDEEINEQFKPLKEKIVSKIKKVKSIKKTIKQLHNKLNSLKRPETKRSRKRESNEAENKKSPKMDDKKVDETGNSDVTGSNDKKEDTAVQKENIKASQEETPKLDISVNNTEDNDLQTE